jgi:cytoskeletal protein CcmA (bactofilin family)
MFGLIQLFRSNDPSPLPTLSIIGDDTTIQGDTVTGSGDLRIEGTIRANVERDGRVVVAKDGAVYGTVRAESILVAGTARGELHAEETLVLAASSDVRARLQADALNIESGADFKGEVCDANDSSSLAPTSGDHDASDELPPPFIDEEASQIFPLEEAMDEAEA